MSDIVALERSGAGRYRAQVRRGVARYSISDLARAAGTTVRNIRAYQGKRLLPEARQEGRARVYSDVHLARLNLIGRLLGRGYNLSNIAELVDALDRGADVQELLGLEEAIAEPLSTELPTYLTVGELVEKFGLEAVTPATIDRAVQAGLLRREGTRFLVPSPRIINLGAELVEAGIPLSALIEEIERLRADMARVADRFVALVATHVVDKVSPQGLPPPSEHRRLAELVTRARPMARSAVDVELARALDGRIQEELERRVEKSLKDLDGAERGRKGRKRGR